MASNPLAILGNLLGGMSQVGAQGATGFYGGDIEGRVLKQNMASQEIRDRLALLHLLSQQSQMNAPIGFGPGTLIMDPRTGQPITQVPFAPPRPIPVGPGHSLVDPTTGKSLLTVPPAPQRPVSLGPGHNLVDPQTGAVISEGPAVPQRPVSVAPGGALVDPNTGKTILERPVPSRPISVGPGHSLVDPATGKSLFSVPPRPLASMIPRETIETTERIVPRKPITNTDTINALNQALPGVVNELSAKPGFRDPGAYVTLPNGMRARKEDIIAQAMLQKFGAEVSVTWDGSRFRIVKAWEPGSREPIEKRRTVGPPRAPQGEDTEE